MSARKRPGWLPGGGGGPGRNPLSVAYDGEVRAFLAVVSLTGSAIAGAVVIPGGAVSAAGVSSRYVLVAIPPGGDPAVYQRAWTASLQYNFRVMFGPTGPTGKPLREKDARGNWSYVRGPWWVHVDWSGPAVLRGAAGMGAVVRIGPQSARPQITGRASYIDNPYNPAG